jgi:hypothetical protein
MSETNNDDLLKDLNDELKEEQRRIEEALSASHSESYQEALKTFVSALKKGARVESLVWDPEALPLEEFLEISKIIRDLSEKSERSTVSDWVKLFRYLIGLQKERVPGNIHFNIVAPGNEIERIMNEKMYQRKEVESMINKFFSKPIAFLIIRKLRQIYPEKIWGQELPVSGIQNVLIGEHLEDLN